MKPRPHPLPIAVAALVWLAPSPATASDAIKAEALFRAGREAVASGDHRLACERFQESQRLDPAPGTLLNIGECREALGQLASAWQAYASAADLLDGGPRRDHAVKKRDELSPRLARVTVRVPEGTSSACTIVQDELALGLAATAVPLPVDAGPLTLELRCPNTRPRPSRLTVEDGASYEVMLAAGDPLASETTPPPPADGPPPLLVSGALIGALGLAGVVVGSVTGALAIDRKGTVEDVCVRQASGRLGCPTEGLDAASDGRAFATTSTIAFAIGGALTALGASLLIVEAATPSGRVTATASARWASAHLTLTF